MNSPATLSMITFSSSNEKEQTLSCLKLAAYILLQLTQHQYWHHPDERPILVVPRGSLQQDACQEQEEADRVACLPYRQPPIHTQGRAGAVPGEQQAFDR